MSAAYPFTILNQPPDLSIPFQKLENIHFNADHAVDFDPSLGAGQVKCKRYSRKVRMAFDQIVLPFEETRAWEFPMEYEQDPVCPFTLSFVSPRTVRIRFGARKSLRNTDESLMLNGPVPSDSSWIIMEGEGAYRYESESGSLTVTNHPFHLELRDSAGKLLTRTQHFSDTKSLHTADNIPFSFLRCSQDMQRLIAASFSLSPGEKIFGCGESFTGLDKRGQKLNLWTTGNHGGQTGEMYKPVPFFMSSRGYGMFVHISAPLTFDFGHTYDEYSTLYVGEDQLDLFIFLGTPKEILSEYTRLTGRSPVPPLWSFGLWMSRITYFSEAEVREVAEKLRTNRIPCDVIHIDTGWFEKDWRCNYEFSPTRFPEPEKLLKDLKEDGLRVSLWQYPYFTPTNELFPVIMDEGYAVKGPNGELPAEDAIIDFSNPAAVEWYRGLIGKLLIMGVSAIKVDFGESAPAHGWYASGMSGWTEHNLYPLRYNKAVFDVTEEVTGSPIIWARSAWAGSQKYPIHWSGDVENTDCGMAATLRAGLSLGLCGFSFWSHDIGGFVKQTPEELYRRWLPFGMLTSHSRCHGAPPKEPWAYSEAFLDEFRRTVEMKYALMPYIYSQAVDSSENGFPMLRTLFFEFPEDPGSWFIEDEYMFGSDLLVAPLMEENQTVRDVYLPPGAWIDYQTEADYVGGCWHRIEAGAIPIVLLVRQGAVIPHVEPAAHTGLIDWSKAESKVYVKK